MAATALATSLLIGAGCSDAYWIKRASSAYTYAEARFERECPPKPEPRTQECLARKSDMRTDYDRIIAAIDSATVHGQVKKAAPLSKTARADMKRIAKKYE